jgi:peptide/nickel transport system permease protein
MTRYAVRRLLQAVLVVFLMSFILYNLIGLMPGDPIDVMLEGNPSVTPEVMARMRALHGMDQPLLVRYWRWLMAALGGDLGYSNTHFRPVVAILGPALLQTVKLLVLTLIASVPLALLLGSIAARKPNGLADTVISFVALASISSPVFWLALVFIIVFAVNLHWFPASGSVIAGDGTVLEQLWHLFLPVLTLTCFSTGQFIRYVRASMIEALNSDYIRTARAKGLGEGTIMVRHALRNAMLPVITVIALSFGALFSGALVVETMYGVLGMGKAIYDAIVGKDFNVALAGLLFATIVTLLANLLADLAYGWLDPRITLE